MFTYLFGVCVYMHKRVYEFVCSSLYIWVWMCMHMNVPWDTSKCHRTTWRNQFSPSSLLVPRIELQLSALAASICFWLPVTFIDTEPSLNCSLESIMSNLKWSCRFLWFSRPLPMLSAFWSALQPTSYFLNDCSITRHIVLWMQVL